MGGRGVFGAYAVFDDVMTTLAEPVDGEVLAACAMLCARVREISKLVTCTGYTHFAVEMTRGPSWGVDELETHPLLIGGNA